MNTETITLGELRKTVKDVDHCPDHYLVFVASPEMDLDGASVKLTVTEGDTSDGPGSLVLEIKER